MFRNLKTRTQTFTSFMNRNDEKQAAAPEAQEAQVTPSKSSGDFELREFEEGAVIA